MKKCNKCGEEKDLELFAKGTGYKDGRRGTCKKCHTAYVTKYYNDRPDKKAAKNKMNNIYQANWKRHHITEEKFIEMFKLHNGLCHSCKENAAMVIDHDHKCCNKPRSCGKCVRGLLCNQCNTAVGLLGDNRQKIKKLLEYIK